MEKIEKNEKLKKLKKDYKIKKDRINTIVFSTISLIAIVSVAISRHTNSGLAILVIGGAVLIALMLVSILIWFSKKGILYASEILFLVNSIFGLVSNKDKEEAIELYTEWKDKYASVYTLFKDINILRSGTIILLARQISQMLQELSDGLRPESTEYQELYKTTQKKLALIHKSKTSCEQLDSLYQKSCSLLEKASYILE